MEVQETPYKIASKIQRSVEKCTSKKKRSSYNVARKKVSDVTAKGCASTRTLLPHPTPPSQPHPNMKQKQKA
jgi:hypothetical protein